MTEQPEEQVSPSNENDTAHQDQRVKIVTYTNLMYAMNIFSENYV